MNVSSNGVVSIVLGPGREEVATILQILEAEALVQLIANTNRWLFLTQGYTDEIFKMFGGVVQSRSSPRCWVT
jgi:hypothetical protein